MLRVGVGIRIRRVLAQRVTTVSAHPVGVEGTVAAIEGVEERVEEASVERIGRLLLCLIPLIVGLVKNGALRMDERDGDLEVEVGLFADETDVGEVGGANGAVD